MPSLPHRTIVSNDSDLADFVKPTRTWLLESCQLPNPVPGPNIYKSASW